MSMGRGRQSWAWQAAWGAHPDPCKGRAWCLLGALCGSGHVHHLLLIISASCMGLALWKLSWVISQAYFMPAGFPVDFLLWNGSTFPTALRNDMVWSSSSCLWRLMSLVTQYSSLSHILLLPVWVFGCHGSSKLSLFPIAKRSESGMSRRAWRAKNAAEDWQVSGAGERRWWAHGWHCLSPLGLGKYFASCCCLWWFQTGVLPPLSQSRGGALAGIRRWEAACCVRWQLYLGSLWGAKSCLLASCWHLLLLKSSWLGWGFFKQSKTKPTALHSYRHILNEVNLIQGVYIQNILKMSSGWTYLPILHFESHGEELHKMEFAFQPAMAVFQLQVSNLADKSWAHQGGMAPDYKCMVCR